MKKKSTPKRWIPFLIGCVAGIVLCVSLFVSLSAVATGQRGSAVPAPGDAAAQQDPAPQPPRETPAQKPGTGSPLDTVVKNGREGIPATVFLPAQPEGAPLAVFCHGFTGNRDGDGHFEPLAQALAKRGIAGISLDFPGCGDSAEPAAAYTLQNMQDDITTAVLWMHQQYGTDTSRLGLVGHSMGGRVASLYAIPKSGRFTVSALALWSPANGDSLTGLEFLDIEAPDNVTQLYLQAQSEGTVNAWGIDLSEQFFHEMNFSHPNAALRQYDGAVLLCYAGHEDLFSQKTVEDTIQTVTQIGGTVTLEPFTEAGHNYTSYDPNAAEETDPVLDEALRTVTLDFLCGALLPE